MKDNIICRLCLNVVPVGYSILKENIANTVKDLTSIDVTDNDDLPQFSCSKCIFNLYFVENIRKLFIRSDETLRSVFNRDGNFSELLINRHVRGSELHIPQDSDYNNYENFKELFDNKNIEVTSILTPEDSSYNSIDIKEESVFPEPLIAEVLQVSDTTKRCDNGSVSVGLDTGNSRQGSPSINFSDSANEDENNIKRIIYKKNNEKPYLYHCNVCNVDFQGHKLYMTHKGKHMKRTCEICGVTTRQDNFNKHMTNHKLGPQVCDICGSIHKSLEGLRTHLFHFHNAKKKPYPCTECGATFKYSHRLTYHKRKVHTGFRPHQCDSCGKRFFDLGTMKKHVKLIHLKLREHHCKYCQKDYSSRHALKVHVRQHTDETPYVCEICSEGFRQLVSLKTHMAKHEKADQASTSQMDQEDEDLPGNDDEKAIVVEEINLL